MNTTFNNNKADTQTVATAMTQAEAMIDASCDEALDLAAFNAAHAGQIRSLELAKQQYQAAQRVNCWFNRAIVAMMLTTAAACFGGLLTMIGH